MNANTLTLVFSGLVTLSTIVYSILTWRLVSETRKMRQFQITPDVNIFFERAEADASFVYIVFRNSGLGHAKNVKFKIIQDLPVYDSPHMQLNKKGLFKNGLDNFYSNQSFKFFFTDLSNNHEQKRDSGVTIMTEYESLDGRKFNRVFTLAFSEILGTSIFTPPDNYIGRIAHELKEIKSILKKQNAEEN